VRRNGQGLVDVDGAIAVLHAGRVQVRVGDLCRFPADAIVNAANSTLLGGGGVDGAIHRAGGPEILAACRGIRAARWPDGLPTGEAVLTTAGLLAAGAVIHTVGPVWSVEDGDPDELLLRAYHSSLALAAASGFRCVAFPAISTGVYGYPRDEAAEVASQAIIEHFDGPDRVEQVVLVFFSQEQAKAFLEASPLVA